MTTERDIMRTLAGGVTTGNSWLRNNPDLAYPDDHENMSDSELMAAITIDDDCESEFHPINE